MNNPSVCCCCGESMAAGLADWHRRCPGCAYESAQLQPSINVADSHEKISEADREVGLKTLRQENFRDIIAELSKLGVDANARLLDVGCAHGWFLEQATAHFTVEGIEPDQAIFNATKSKAYPVRCGYFPDILRETETFDVIVFNDVIEHIPDINAALDSCSARLNTGGFLVLNLPSTKGSIYRFATWLAKLGMRSPFQRLWQLGYPSPHVHYFDHNNLPKLVQAHGFELLVDRELASVTRSGLFERIYYGGEYKRLLAVLIYAGMSLALPLIKSLPSDILLQIYRKPG